MSVAWESRKPVEQVHVRVHGRRVHGDWCLL
jgi:hypothetical protein